MLATRSYTCAQKLAPSFLAVSGHERVPRFLAASYARPKAHTAFANAPQTHQHKAFQEIKLNLLAPGKFAHNLSMGRHVFQKRAPHFLVSDFGGPPLQQMISRTQDSLCTRIMVSIENLITG